jgi:hypothetical protein
MKVSYIDIIQLLSAQDELNKLKLPAKYAIRVARAIRRAQDYYKDVEEIRKKILSDVGIVEGDDLTEEQKRQNEAKLGEANELFNKALEEEVEIDINPISLAELDGTELSVELLQKTLWLWGD